jgi:hypothetical protein
MTKGEKLVHKDSEKMKKGRNMKVRESIKI